MSSAHTWLRGEGMSIREVADAMGITPMRVQQLETSAINKLRRNPWAARRLFQFVQGSFEPVHQPRAREGAK